ncbi:MAG: hypothetical protein M1826_006381 [Phylliscum demangeonii]|nr:MAG: hypothetical protein M1826_006381 [Phylliscum demangeonii]
MVTVGRRFSSTDGSLAPAALPGDQSIPASNKFPVLPASKEPSVHPELDEPRNLESSGKLLKDPYNPHGLVASDIPGRLRLPFSARPKGFSNDPVAWTRFQNVEHISSRILTKRNVEREASAKGKSAYRAGEDRAALHNPYNLEAVKTPGRDLRLPYEHQSPGFQGDEADYIFAVNTEEVEYKLKIFDGQRWPPWGLFIECMTAKDGPALDFSSYFSETLDPAAMQKMRDHESYCVDDVNRRVDADAHSQQKQAHLPVRTYDPIDPRHHPGKQQEQQQQQQQQQPRHEFSTVPLANWAHRADHFVTTQGRRLHLGALPLQKLVQEAHTKLPAWEAEYAH